jgi:hypothetical protein
MSANSGSVDVNMRQGKGGAVEIDPNQGGNKAAERPGANNGIVDHPQVDKIDHAGHSSRAKAAMAEMGHHNVSYHDGGVRE